ncbi:hypothetical protein EP47_00325 [Legionella norrlandica]|uniref:Uncharacterized protein n=1 Tax=Legionella norrlandica TaxID=1498499 RepID=A0A0A2TA87_9GAMM|nr:hypothetical protein [Legionella norrlandica]KGP64328.1 hypothetical protein EP47_00325 [Legionella norrlandica]
MKKHDITAIHSYIMDEKCKKISPQLMEKLYCFLSQYYHLANQEEFIRLIIQPDLDGELTVLYGKNKEIAGFCRNCRQSIDLGKKQITCYVAYIYLHPDYQIDASTKSAGISQAIKYKLANPQEELVYIAFANNPSAYEFIYQLSDLIYPKPSQRVPEQILTILNAFKKQNGWLSTNSHPMVVNSPLVPLRSQFSKISEEGNELKEFYISANPDYLQGNSLLVYMPLHLANISYGINHSGSSSYHNQKQHQVSARKNGSSDWQN